VVALRVTMVNMTKNELYWLAGLLEGEGSFLAGPPSRPHLPLVALSMTDEDVVAKVAKLTGYSYCRSDRGKEKGWKPAYIMSIKGNNAVLLMNMLRPFMGDRRRRQIDRAVASYAPKQVRKLTYEDAVEIRRQLAAGERGVSLAKSYGVSKSMISKIKAGKKWDVDRSLVVE